MATRPNISDDDAYRVALAKVVVAIAPTCLETWDGSDDSNQFDKESFAKETVDLAEALLAEVNKRLYPRV